MNCQKEPGNRNRGTFKTEYKDNRALPTSAAQSRKTGTQSKEGIMYKFNTFDLGD